MSTQTTPSQQYPGLYRAAVDDAVSGGAGLMARLVSAAVLVLRARERASSDVRERDRFAASADRLQREEKPLCAQYPQSLRDAFLTLEKPHHSKPLTQPVLDFDQLELMDARQVEESVVLARAQQSVVQASDASLAELDALMCGAQGLAAVHPERNPLRPQAYLDALKDALGRVDVPDAMRSEWLASMGGALGKELSESYRLASVQLRNHGVLAVGYAVVAFPGKEGVMNATIDAERSLRTSKKASRTDPGGGDKVARAVVDRRKSATDPAGYQGRTTAPQVAGEDALLTLDKLRLLLKGELNQFQSGPNGEAFADQFSRVFESGSVPVDAQPTNFDATVPAALDALHEMQQLDHVVHRLEQRKAQRRAGAASALPLDNAVRAALQGQVKGVAQALSVEVVKLMVDNIARDRRLLEPVQQVIRELEPALARLSLVDPRMFTNKQHPARVLVHEVAHNSMAYASTQATGFADFLAGVQQALRPLGHDAIDSGEPFERVLVSLRERWKTAAKIRTRDRDRAVKILEHAEQRNLLAEKIARQIAAHRDAALVPAVVLEFLCGPWVQVVAQARIVSGVGSDVADRYQALVAALLWSAHPALTHNNTAKLTRLVPPLLATLREGLQTIHYPAVKTSAFIEVLMGLHQKVFRSDKAPRDVAAALPLVIEKGGRTVLIEEGNPWVAPDEARASNFMDLPAQGGDDDLGDSAAVAQASEVAGTSNANDDAQAFLTDAESDINNLSLGAWVELKAGNAWVRTQLTWTSPHGTLFLFTSALGATRSMTRRSRDKLVASGNLRVISGQPVVDGALDAVAQQAMRNSVGMSP